MKNIKSLQSENEQLRIAIGELQVLNDVATAISSVQSVDEIIDQIVLKCTRHFAVEEAAISLLERETDEQVFHTMVRHRDTSGKNLPYRLDAGLKGWMLKNRKSFLSNNIQEDDRFKFLSQEDYTFKSLISVPLMVKGELIGYLAIFNKKSGEFTEENKRLLSIIGSQSAQILENARLLEEEKDLLALRNEMKLAGEIQRKLLPDSTPDIPGFQFFATNMPAKSVGGDYYDFLPVDDNKFAFCIADITGKGMPAAMLMANLQATFRSQVIMDAGCCTCISRTNKILFNNTEPSKFATMFYGVLNADNGMLEYTNGGHDQPILFRSGKGIEYLQSTGLILGILEDSEYLKGDVNLEPGNVLLLYSDGITEAMNPASDMYGIEKAIEIVSDNVDKSAQKIAELLLSDVRRHTKGALQSDDITLMLIKRDFE